jgi:hypothetical protein
MPQKSPPSSLLAGSRGRLGSKSEVELARDRLDELVPDSRREGPEGGGIDADGKRE